MSLHKLLATLALALLVIPARSGDLPQPRRLLEGETFWDNRDWDWYQANIPFFECPDRDITAGNCSPSI